MLYIFSNYFLNFIFINLLKFFIIWFLTQGFYVKPWLSRNVLWRPGWPWILRSACVCVPRAGMEGVGHHARIFTRGTCTGLNQHLGNSCRFKLEHAKLVEIERHCDIWDFFDLAFIILFWSLFSFNFNFNFYFLVFRKRVSLSSLCRAGWPRTQRSTWLCLWRVGRD